MSTILRLAYKTDLLLNSSSLHPTMVHINSHYDITFFLFLYPRQKVPLSASLNVTIYSLDWFYLR